MIHKLWDRNGKSCCSGQVLSFTDIARSGAAVLKAMNDNETTTWTSQAEPSKHNACWMWHYLLFWLKITAWTRHEACTQRLKLCFLWFIPVSPNCWSVVADKTSDRYGSLSVCSVLPRATADEDAQREVQVRANLFARPSISSFLIRIVEKSTAGGRLYGHHHPTSPYSLVLHSLAP